MIPPIVVEKIHNFVTVKITGVGKRALKEAKRKKGRNNNIL